MFKMIALRGDVRRFFMMRDLFVSADDIALLVQEEIYYFTKPLLYSTVLRALTCPPNTVIEGVLGNESPPQPPESDRKRSWMRWPFRKQLMESTQD